MTPRRRRRLADVHLRGLAPKPQECYIAAVHQRAQYAQRPPDQLSAEELRQDVLVLRHEKKVAASTGRIHLSGIKCLDEMTRQRPWPVFALVRPGKSQKLPVVVRVQEVRHLLPVVEHATARRCRRLIDACGLRLTEGTRLHVADSDPQRRLGRVRHGQGGRDRRVPLAPRVLAVLRADGQRPRPRPWGCPARHRAGPLSPPSRQKTFKAVVRQRGIPTDASVHTLRHASATPLLERGGPWRVLQELLGHKRPRTTARSPHLPPPPLDVVHATITALLAAL